MSPPCRSLAPLCFSGFLLPPRTLFLPRFYCACARVPRAEPQSCMPNPYHVPTHRLPTPLMLARQISPDMMALTLHADAIADARRGAIHGHFRRHADAREPPAVLRYFSRRRACRHIVPPWFSCAQCWRAPCAPAIDILLRSARVDARNARAAHSSDASMRCQAMRTRGKSSEPPCGAKSRATTTYAGAVVRSPPRLSTATPQPLCRDARLMILLTQRFMLPAAAGAAMITRSTNILLTRACFYALKRYGFHAAAMPVFAPGTYATLFAALFPLRVDAADAAKSRRPETAPKPCLPHYRRAQHAGSCVRRVRDASATSTYPRHADRSMPSHFRLLSSRLYAP